MPPLEEHWSTWGEFQGPAPADLHQQPGQEEAQDNALQSPVNEPAQVLDAPLEEPATGQQEDESDVATDDEETYGVLVADEDYSGYVPSGEGVGFSGGAFPYEAAMQQGPK